MVDRRAFLMQMAAGGLCLSGAGIAAKSPAAEQPRFPLCTFVKFLQSLSFDDLAAALADLDLQGIEATVRPGGQILPEEAPDRLPELVEALRRQGLEITIMTSGINRADDRHAEKVLRAAAALGVRRYRLNYYRYDLNRPVADQLRQLRPVVRDLAAMNRELGIAGLYQNHAGAQYVGAGLWDLCELLADIDPDEIGIAYDIRHAAAEGGLSWPATWNRAQAHLRAVYVKDCLWRGRKLENVPLGEGLVQPAFYAKLKALAEPVPVSVHVEYLEREPVEAQLAAIRRDLATFRAALSAT